MCMWVVENLAIYLNIMVGSHKSVAVDVSLFFTINLSQIMHVEV